MSLSDRQRPEGFLHTITSAVLSTDRFPSPTQSTKPADQYADLLSNWFNSVAGENNTS